MKKILYLSVMMTMVLALSVQAQAALQTIGTATYNSSNYGLIYDDDLNITWLDYSNASDTWVNQKTWADGLNTGGVLTYNFNVGVSMNWSDVWRLPTTIDGPLVVGYDGSTTAGFNITSSEMGHLFYEELGNNGFFATDGTNPTNYGLTYTGDFQHLQDGIYWSGTEYDANTLNAWDFETSVGHQYYGDKTSTRNAIAVRPGLAVVPEPISSTLFLIGGVALGFRRFRKHA